MPSDGKEPANTVPCTMVGEMIPASVCDAEQGATHCQGCTAATRRCLNCNKARGIADGQRGWCETCLSKSGEKVVNTSSADQPDLSLASVLARARAVRKVEPMEPGMPHSTQGDAKPVHAAITKDLSAINLVLLEHGVQRNGTWVINAPRRVLIHHVRLLPEEADAVLKRLVAQGYLKGDSVGDEVTLLKTDGIEEIKTELDRPRSSMLSSPEPKKQRRGAGKKKTDAAPKPASASTPTPPKPPPLVVKPKPAAPTVARPETPPPTPRPTTPAKPLGTYAEAYASLVERGQMIGGQRIIRGAVPVLQMRWRIGPDDATKILEKLLRDGHISQRDGWRSIALLKDAIVDETPLPSKEATRKPSSHTPHIPHGPRPRPPMPTPGSSAATATAVEADTALDPLDAAIQAIEAQLHTLRELHEGVAQEMQTLEACLSALQRAKQRGSELSPQLRDALTKSALANANLLAALSS